MTGMDASEFAEFFRLQGNRVIETKSCFWYKPLQFAYLSIPYHRLVTPSRLECASVFVSGPSALLRYATFLNGNDANRWLYVCTDKNYGLQSMQSRTRNKTRRGLENCKIEQLDFSYLATAGQALNEQTARRHLRGDSREAMGKRWIRYCNAASRIRDFQAWGAFVEGKLASCMVTALVEDCFTFLHHSSADEYLKHYPSNALYFTIARMKLDCPEVNSLSLGVKSPGLSSGLDNFKLRMGFVRHPFHLQLVINPVLRPFLAMGGKTMINRIAEQSRQQSSWRYLAEDLNRV